MKSCFTCKYRGRDPENQWTGVPAYKCTNKKSWRGRIGSMVLKGMTCTEFKVARKEKLAA